MNGTKASSLVTNVVLVDMAENDGKLKLGQLFERDDSTVVAFTEQTMDSRNADLLVGQAFTEISPIDLKNSEVRVYTVPSAALEAFVLQSPTTLNLDLPPVLTSITSVFNVSEQVGESVQEVGAAFSSGSSGGFSVSADANASAAAGVIPDVSLDIREVWATNVPAQTYLFYMSSETITVAAIITRLHTILTFATTGVAAGVVTATAHGLTANQPFQFATLVGGAGGIATGTTYFVRSASLTANTFTYSVTAGGAALSGHSATSGTLFPVVAAWPAFKPKAISLSLLGQTVRVQQGANAHLQNSWSADTLSYVIFPITSGGSPTRADSISRSTDLSVRTVRISPTLHGALSISPSSDTADADVEVVAIIPEVVGTGIAPSFDPIENQPTPVTLTATGTISPSSFSATTGYTDIPTAGLFIHSLDSDIYKWGYNRVRVVLVNFSFAA